MASTPSQSSHTGHPTINDTQVFVGTTTPRRRSIRCAGSYAARASRVSTPSPLPGPPPPCIPPQHTLIYILKIRYYVYIHNTVLLVCVCGVLHADRSPASPTCRPSTPCAAGMHLGRGSRPCSHWYEHRHRCHHQQHGSVRPCCRPAGHEVASPRTSAQRRTSPQTPDSPSPW
jgi:hypothetical protein